MTEASEVARHALTDLRAMLGVLRTDEAAARLAPQPGIGDLGALVERFRATRAAGGPGCRGHAVPARRRHRADRIPDRAGGADQYPAARRGPPRGRHPRLRPAPGPGAGHRRRHRAGPGHAPGPRHRGHARTGRAARRHAPRRARPGIGRGLAGRGHPGRP